MGATIERILCVGLKGKRYFIGDRLRVKLYNGNVKRGVIDEIGNYSITLVGSEGLKIICIEEIEDCAV